MLKIGNETFIKTKDGRYINTRYVKEIVLVDDYYVFGLTDNSTNIVEKDEAPAIALEEIKAEMRRIDRDSVMRK